MRKVTDKQKANLRPFKKGDPRINRNGRPKSFDQLRELAQQIAAEKFDDKKTVIENILETMTKDKKMMKDFLEFAFGKVPLSQIVDITSGGKVISWNMFINNDNDNDSSTENKSEETSKQS